MNPSVPLSLAGRHVRCGRLLLVVALLLAIVNQSLLAVPHSASAAASMIKVPVPSGTVMTVTQGYNGDPNNGGSHYDCPDYPATGCANTWRYKYSLDLTRSS